MRTLIFITLFLAIPVRNACARPGRSRLVIHADKEITYRFGVMAKLVPSHDLMVGPDPLSFVGFLVKPVDGLLFIPTIGYAFRQNEAITGLEAAFHQRTWWTWLETAIRPQSGEIHALAQIEIRIPDSWGYLGAEAESRSTHVRPYRFSTGVGPNVVLKFDAARFDVALQARRDARWGPELVTRFYLYFR